MSKNTSRDNAAIRTALMDVLTDLQMYNFVPHYESIQNEDIKAGMAEVVELKTKLADMSAGENAEASMKSIGRITYLITKGLSEISEEDIFTMNMIDSAILTNFKRLQKEAGVKDE